MGKFDGKQITGLVGGLVFKAGQDKKVTIIQTKAINIKQTKGTIESGILFGKASTLARTMREDLYPLINDNYDGTMVNRFTKITRELIAHCYDKSTKKFTFKPDSFDRLTGFEFNTKSPLTSNLWVNPEVSLSNNQLQVNLPELQISEHLKFPSTANTCQIKVVLAKLILNDALHTQNAFQSVEISESHGTIPAQQFVFDVPDGCLCVVGINLNFTKKQGSMQTVLNDKSFNPAAICGAIISPGTFLLPSPIHTSEWREIDGLKL